MDKEALLRLQDLDTTDVACRISNEMNRAMIRGDRILKGTVLACILCKLKSNLNVPIENKEAFKEYKVMPQRVEDIVDLHLDELWDVAKMMERKFDTEKLLAFILFNNDLMDDRHCDLVVSRSINELALNLLDIQTGDKLCNVFSGNGAFMVDAFLNKCNFDFTGIELNYSLNEVAEIRKAFLNRRGSVILGDSVEYRGDEKFDKIFISGPIGTKQDYSRDQIDILNKETECKLKSIKRISTEWAHIISAISQLKEDGKGVAIVTDGILGRINDNEIRKYIIEKGKIEAVISLPPHLFKNSGVKVSLLLISDNNKCIKFVDASEIYRACRSGNIITYDNVSEIINLLSNDGDRTVTKSLEELAKSNYSLSFEKLFCSAPVFSNGTKLGSLTRNIYRGAQLRSSELDKLISTKKTPYLALSVGDLENGGLSKNSNYLKYIPDNLKKYCIKNNSIVVSRTGAPTFKSAVVNIEDDIEILATGNLIVLELDQNKINPYFLQAFFCSEEGEVFFKYLSLGASLKMLSIAELKKAEVPCPSVEVQRKISEIYQALSKEIINTKLKLQSSINKLKHVYDDCDE